MFSIPSPDAPGMCDNYDLSKLASMGTQTFQAGDGYTYMMSFCGNVPEASIPKECAQVNSTFGPAVAYQYNSKSCYALGKLDAAYVVCCSLFASDVRRSSGRGWFNIFHIMHNVWPHPKGPR